MKTIRDLYRIGYGPSSSHTIAPRAAALLFKQRNDQAAKYRVTLYGSLAATGRGHGTDVVIYRELAPAPTEILWQPETVLPYHPNGMRFEALSPQDEVISSWVVFSTGGGELREENQPPPPSVYELHSMREILQHCTQNGLAFWEYVESREGNEIWEYLHQVWHTMQAAIERGVRAEGVLPGGLGLARKAWAFYRRARLAGPKLMENAFLSAYALAVAEENASGGLIATAPTCGSSGVLPAILRYIQEILDCHEDTILHALATAGLVGNLVKHNASISGAVVGCQGEIGTACAMAAAAATQLLGGTIRQIEYAAEMGLEHHLGLTCDPVDGLVQVPCIERNAFAATRALSCANFAMFSDGSHLVPFDEVVEVMEQTGHDLPSLYRETSSGGLAKSRLEKDL
ncbi:MAG: L-serine ammonia-lyase [Anaerolineae bacterium]|nr:L-serine ammonia-lyase [Anaerolineae bacterium]